MNRRMMATLGAAVALAACATLVGGGQDAALAAERQPIGTVPLVRQVYRNNCETASLSMLLAAAGVRVDQRTLQRQVRRSGPLDPIVRPDGSWVWGNPEKGFVGRARGGGTAGGFGVYQRPIRALAARYGVSLRDLSRKPARVIFAELARGRPVMAWIGLSEGPYRWWRTPAGKLIRVNFGEHVVALTRLHGDSISVNDPLTGSRLQWTRAQFLAKWRLLGRRALGFDV
jgi:uncharacterized protein YvpB